MSRRARRRRIMALALQHVGPVDAGGRDADQDLARRPAAGRGRSTQIQRLRSAGSGRDDGAHVEAVGHRGPLMDSAFVDRRQSSTDRRGHAIERRRGAKRAAELSARAQKSARRGIGRSRHSTRSAIVDLREAEGADDGDVGNAELRRRRSSRSRGVSRSSAASPRAIARRRARPSLRCAARACATRARNGPAPPFRTPSARRRSRARPAAARSTRETRQRRDRGREGREIVEDHVGLDQHGPVVGTSVGAFSSGLSCVNSSMWRNSEIGRCAERDVRPSAARPRRAAHRANPAFRSVASVAPPLRRSIEPEAARRARA